MHLRNIVLQYACLSYPFWLLFWVEIKAYDDFKWWLLVSNLNNFPFFLMIFCLVLVDILRLLVSNLNIFPCFVIFCLVYNLFTLFLGFIIWTKNTFYSTEVILSNTSVFLTVTLTPGAREATAPLLCVLLVTSGNYSS